MPDLSGVPVAAFGSELVVTEPSATYRVRVDPAEESQHTDLPPGSDQEILVLPVTVDVAAGRSAVGIDTFAVFDEHGTRCTVPEDQVGYPVLPGTAQPAGTAVQGVVGVQAMRGTRTFVVVHSVAGVPVAAWR